MSYNQNKLSVEGYLKYNAPSTFTYDTEDDTLAQVSASGFFVPGNNPSNRSENLADKIKIFDFIKVAASDESDMLWVESLDPIETVSMAGSDPTDLNLDDSHIFVGDSSNKAADVAVSGDATIDNTGAVTVVSAQGDFEMGAGGSGKVIATGITASSGAAAVAVTGRIHEVTTTGTGDALTLADGTAGQQLTVIYVAEGAGGDTAVLTPTTLAGGTTITFNALGDSADLTYSATGGWYMHGGTAVVA